ncbi:ribosome biogenesis GTP-binding protein YihA/YsxC [Aestuariispira insulae]|uniref:Probable GTP-binding protein EngB n=1 Tax=Aestuariispira insulae TaxID=1461337 RepID=A0A3D9H794_9PROT|nr:ribosome biogenesis GTP-binding protein YihA/YsxC [Aestuariispira insulae]RED45031.1 GTP-binding protein [Aestuariispira insulae]
MQFTDEEIEQGRLLFAQSCQFLLGVANLKQLPGDVLPEIAFAGRSNVGKSSLVNALTGRKTLARTSNTPGRTRELNFFNLGDRLMMVDLPGHGYARVSKTEVHGWTKLVRDYLRGRQSLKKLCLLVDARHGLKDTDEELMDMMDEAGVAYQLILTKVDKVKTQQRDKTLAGVQAAIKKRAAAFPEVMVTSSHKGWGVPELRALLNGVASPTPIARG